MILSLDRSAYDGEITFRTARGIIVDQATGQIQAISRRDGFLQPPKSDLMCITLRLKIRGATEYESR